jgi:hypothetical protein
MKWNDQLSGSLKTLCRYSLTISILGWTENDCRAADVVSIEQIRTDGAAAGAMEQKSESADSLEANLSAGYESRYVSEGRDNLGGDSLLGTTLEVGYQGFTAGFWYANSPEADYEETNSWLQYNHALGDFEISVAYTHLRFLSDDDYDNELGLGVEYGALPWNLSVSALGYYSFDAEGSFFELGLNGEYEIKPWLTLSPYLLFGLNSGYITDGHDGANNLELGLAGEIPLGKNWSLVGHVSYNFEINSDPAKYAGDESLNNFFHGGVALMFSF